MIEVNGIEFRRPERPVVVVCIDGSDPAYHDRGLADGILPNMARFAETGFAALADGVVPSFTNPNNLSIVTGAPPAVHRFHLDVNQLARCAPLTVKSADRLPKQRMPAIVDHRSLPDMGRMTPRWPWGGKIISSWAPNAAANQQPSPIR